MNTQILPVEQNMTFNKTEVIEEIDGLKIAILGLEWLDQFNEFIQKVYYNSRSDKYAWKENEIEELTEDSEFYFPHTKLAAVLSDGNEIIGTWGLILKDIRDEDSIQLPIERKFNITPAQINEIMGMDAVYMFNGWRAAIDKDLLEKLGYDKSTSIRIFDMLLRGLSEEFAEDSSKYMGVAEMEHIVLRYHKRIGIPWKILGEGKTYWGSTKFPSAFSQAEFEMTMKTNHPERYNFIYKRDR